MDRDAIPRLLTEAHRDAQEPSFTSIERALLPMLGGDDAPSAETIRAYHRGPLPKKPNVELLLGLTRFYGRRVDWLGTEVAEHAKRLMVLVGGGGAPGEDSVTRRKQDRGSHQPRRVA